MSFIMRHKNHCFSNEFFRSKMGVCEAVQAYMEIRYAMLIIFTEPCMNRLRVKENVRRAFITL